MIASFVSADGDHTHGQRVRKKKWRVSMVGGNPQDTDTDRDRVFHFHTTHAHAPNTRDMTHGGKSSM